MGDDVEGQDRRLVDGNTEYGTSSAISIGREYEAKLGESEDFVIMIEGEPVCEEVDPLYVN